MKVEHLDATQATAAKAVAEGGSVVSPRRIRWDISGNCSCPYESDRFGRADLDHPGAQEALHREMGRVNRTCWVELSTRCRRCESCREARKRLWRSRAAQEIAHSTRTWFGTLTCRPDFHQVLLDRARVRARDYGRVDLDAMGQADVFLARSQELLREVQLYIKRLRKHAKLRYLVVVEAHESGLPHVHFLMHECDDLPVRHAMLKSQWPHGFIDAKLVEPSDTRAAAYVSKYLSKSALARVRASERYGRGFPVSHRDPGLLSADIAKKFISWRESHLTPGGETGAKPEGHPPIGLS